jgi:serine protease Do
VELCQSEEKLESLEHNPVIMQSLPAVKRATFSVLLPEPKRRGLPAPVGSGFFVSADGWFVTARHLLAASDHSDAPLRDDLGAIVLMNPCDDNSRVQKVINLELMHCDVEHDFALLKANPTGQERFSHIEVSTRAAVEGEPVYCFGYPLSDLCDPQELPPLMSTFSLSWMDGWLLVLKPRVSSAIVAARPFPTSAPGLPKLGSCYAIDRTIEFGMSGAPVIATETGNAFAVACHVESTSVPQLHLSNLGRPKIVVPSQFGSASSMASEPIVEVLRQHGIAMSTR